MNFELLRPWISTCGVGKGEAQGHQASPIWLQSIVYVAGFANNLINKY